MQPRHSTLCSLNWAFPERKLTNAELAAKFPDWNVEKIEEKTGISCRHIAGPDETALDLGVAAASRLLDSARINRESIDGLVFCTQSPDYALPPNSSLAQHRLALATSIAAMDISQGCSGFVYALAAAQGMIAAGQARKVLLITAETFSKYIAGEDKSLLTIFGDAGAAAIVEISDSPGIGPFVFLTDGAAAHMLSVPESGTAQYRPKNPLLTPQHFEAGRTARNLYMNGPRIFQFTLDVVPSLVKQLLQRAELDMESVDFFVFHQANNFMLESLRRKCGIPQEKFIIDMADCGNTTSSTIPIALKRAIDGGRIKSGQKVLLAGFGVGLSAAATIVNF